MPKKIRFGILRKESKFSDLSPGLQSLFNSAVVQKLRKQEAEELEVEGQIEDDDHELTEEELDGLLENVSPEVANEILKELDEIVFYLENKEMKIKESQLDAAGIPSKIQKGRRRRIE